MRVVGSVESLLLSQNSVKLEIASSSSLALSILLLFGGVTLVVEGSFLHMNFSGVVFLIN